MSAGSSALTGSVPPSLAPTLPKGFGVRKASVFAVLLLGAVLVVPATLLALPWNDDMKDQPSVKTQETTVELPAESVPADGGELDGPADLAELVRARLKAGEQLSNPLGAEDADDARAAEMYDIYCRVCHGVAGAGDGSVGLKYNPQPMDLTLPYVQQQSDGQLYYTITHGGVIMPSYRFAMSKEDRWRIVQYLRTGLLEEAARVAEAAESESGGETAAE